MRFRWNADGAPIGNSIIAYKSSVLHLWILTGNVLLVFLYVDSSILLDPISWRILIINDYWSVCLVNLLLLPFDEVIYDNCEYVCL